MRCEPYKNFSLVGNARFAQAVFIDLISRMYFHNFSGLAQPF